jgi:hypothetical protein
VITVLLLECPSSGSKTFAHQKVILPRVWSPAGMADAAFPVSLRGEATRGISVAAEGCLGFPVPKSSRLDHPECASVVARNSYSKMDGINS